AVIVEPGGAGRPLARVLHPSLFRDLGERPIPVVVKQRAGGIAGDKQIGVAVVVVVADGDSHSVKILAIDSGFGGDLLELAVPQVAIQRVAHGSGAFAARCFAAIYEKNVQQSVVVEVQESYSASHRLDEKAVRGLAT